MDFISDFVELTAKKGTPAIYRKWAAIGLVSASLSRKVWTSTMNDEPTYGNMNIMLVGRPAQGKSSALKPVKELLDPFSTDGRVMLAPKITTLPALMQQLGKYFSPKAKHWPRSYLVIADELGTLFEEWDPHMMQVLAALWDNEKKFDKNTKTQGVDRLTEPYVTLLAGAQPQWLADAFPKGAFNTGLPSRFIFIYTDELRKLDFSHELPTTSFGEAWEALREPVWRIMQAEGYAPFDHDAWVEYQTWRAEGGKPVPTDPLLSFYVHRRAEHVGKLALVVAMSRHPDDMRVTRADLLTALELLFEAEERMGEALAMAGGGNPLWQHQVAMLDYVRERKGPVSEVELRARFVRVVPPRELGPMIDALVGKHLVQVNKPAKSPSRVFVLGKDV